VAQLFSLGRLVRLQKMSGAFGVDEVIFAVWRTCGFGFRFVLREAQFFVSLRPAFEVWFRLVMIIHLKNGAKSKSHVDLEVLCPWIMGFVDTHRPNKSPEPTAGGAVSSAVAVHVTGRRWLNFFR
jgi:hypothetical protein